ncbi:hypothetical protein LGH70_15115 [Hymenobacter sp. BT635]|uniref:Uncharacterized protein n=1 Tax=Hymenobacter nitidus TaxID=2880929 RepID=A0ABS8AFQ5_9BACT|nr:hypothetical protein [Hymenobacter nitidus]MCB2378929.1 hypothetical protein [Hymenobacter nitidus]
MNDVILRAKHWQVFLLLLAPHVASWYTTSPFTDRILDLVSVFVLMAWVVLQVNALNQLRANLEGYSVTWFLINVFVVLTAWSYSSISEDPDFYISGTKWQVSGMGSLAFLYIVFAYLHVHWFPGSMLKATETGERTDASQGLKAFLLYFFWPIGVWLIQPRLNKLWEEQQWSQRAIQNLGTDIPLGMTAETE